MRWRIGYRELMNRIEFDYYDLKAFEAFLDKLPEKDSKE